ncbi:DUF6875 domain-containing protein [Streptomyces sp. DSM 15324]|uniref:DUF6875 domain-containing protein n=1 Tax=Streptomyces sp. DSM 15324 TaxID=1739111 RepID=UPI000747B4B4|nr:hypothetical protein [Streptomyces sp. DSM 15324]KUO08885.1 hypothetical protein AQJ58_26125 [Streptomyces sp. DSM 15324]
MSSGESVVSIDSTLAVVDSWLTEYISARHPEIGRIGPICPFVAPSRKNRTLETRVRFVGHSPTLELIEEIARSSLREYGLISWQGRNPMLRSMIVVLPDLRSEDTKLLDEAQIRVKDEFVEQGLMVGQFHENCEVTAARNPDFAVSRAPVPVLAIRTIALHDIFFLSEHRHWFEKYREKFGKFYTPESMESDDQFRVEHYLGAARAYGYPT